MLVSARGRRPSDTRARARQALIAVAAGGLALGALLEYFLDPRAGRRLNARRRAQEQLDDVTLAQKVESQLFRRAGVPKGQVSVNAEEGVVFLRGVMERQEDIDRMGEEARRIAGVRAVENLLHVAGTRAPAGRSKLERQRAKE